jgi:hypothetical protein
MSNFAVAIIRGLKMYYGWITALIIFRASFMWGEGEASI